MSEPAYSPGADALLQTLYNFAYSSAPALYGHDEGKIVHGRIADFDKDQVRPFIQACGVLYERDHYTIITDQCYDVMAQWLGDSAATAMDWETYPPDVLDLADSLKAAHEWRAYAIESFNLCPTCNRWDMQPCNC